MAISSPRSPTLPADPGGRRRNRRAPTAVASTSPGRAGTARRTATALPGGRAVVGALLVSLAAVGVLAAYVSASAGPQGTFVVARRPIDVGQRIDPEDLRVERIDLPPSVAAQAFDDLEGLTGSVAVAPITEGQLVARSAVRVGAHSGSGPDDGAGTPTAREFSFAVERERALDGQLARGEQVDLLATFGNGDRATTIVAARAVPIIRLSDQGKGSIGAGGKLVLTIALDDIDTVTRLAHATQVAAITVVRSTGAAAPAGALEAYQLPEVDAPETTAGSSPPSTTARDATRGTAPR